MAGAPYPRTLTIGNFTGILASIAIPASYATPQTDDFIAFYLGFNSAAGSLMEGGPSYSFAYNSWHYFLNPGKGNTGGGTFKLSPQPSPGATITVQLLNNGGGSASLTVYNNVLTANNPHMGASTLVKMVMSYNDPHNPGMVQHSNATINAQVQASAGGPWLAFPAYTTDAPVSPRYTVMKWSPLVASLAT